MAIVGQGITAYPQPDDALNENSKNPVQNKVVAGNIKELKGKDTVQDERIAAMEQVTTATTIGPVAIATFDASAANMPLKGLTANIGPVQDLHGYDRPWPAGGGKNLWNPDWVINGYISSASHDIISDPSAKTVYIPVNEGLTYTVSKIVTTRFRYGFASEMPASGKHCSDYGQQDSAESITVVAPTGALYLCVYVCASDSDNTVLPSVQIEVGSTATAYSPYSNICPITGWTGANVGRTGKNYIDGTKWDVIRNTTAYVGINTGESIYAPAGEYTFSFTFKNNVRYRVYFMYTGADWSTRRMIVSETGTSEQATLTVDGRPFKIWFYSTSGSVSTDSIANVQLERGSNRTEFEPYSGTVISINFLTEAGTVYGGTLDVTTGVLEVKYIKFTLTLDLEYRNNSDRANAFSVYVSLPFRAKGQFDMYCNCLKVQENARDAVVPATQIASSLWTAIIAFPKTIVSSFDDVRTKITELYNSGTPIEIVYQIDQPIVYQLTLQEVTTLLGTNSIWADCGDVTVTYGAYLETVKELVDKREVREEQVEGTVVNLNAEPNTRYICGEVATLDITLPVSGTCDIVFTSGSTPTVLTVPSTVKWMHGFDPTALAADTIYELNITDGLGVVASWT